MTIEFQNYTLKPPNLVVFKVTDIQETYDWLELNLSPEWEVSIMGSSLIFHGEINGQPSYNIVFMNSRIAQDENGNIYKIEETLLSTMFDLVTP